MNKRQVPCLLQNAQIYIGRAQCLLDEEGHTYQISDKLRQATLWIMEAWLVSFDAEFKNVLISFLENATEPFKARVMDAYTQADSLQYGLEEDYFSGNPDDVSQEYKQWEKDASACCVALLDLIVVLKNKLLLA